jgi:serine/threonine-protein kinase
MGTVYRAAQINPRRTVAIKVLNPLPGGQAAVRALRRESGLMAALAHPGVVAVHDCGEVGGRPYLVLEYIAGPNLRALLHPGLPWPAEQARALLDGIARALGYIHAQGILHLDLKPENVLLGNREQGTAEKGLWARPLLCYSLFPVPCSLRSRTSAWPCRGWTPAPFRS